MFFDLALDIGITKFHAARGQSFGQKQAIRSQAAASRVDP